MTANKLRKFWNCGQRGTAAVEFAIVLPVMLLVIFGIIQFGSIYFLHNNMVNAARDAARLMAVKDETDVTTVQQKALDGLAYPGLSYTVEVCAPDVACAIPVDDPVNDVVVEIGVPLSEATIVDLLGIFADGNLVATVVMRKEG